MILKWMYAQICAFQWTKVKRCFCKSFLSLPNFWVQKCKIQRFEEIKRFECSFYWIRVQVITNLASRLEKCQTLDFFYLWPIFYDFWKKISISAFSDFFENLQLHMLKSLYQLTKYRLKSSKTVRVTSHIDRVLMPIIWFIRVNKG